MDFNFSFWILNSYFNSFYNFETLIFIFKRIRKYEIEITRC